MNCPDCFKDVRSRNDQLAQAAIDAKKYAVDNQVNVYIYEEGFNNFQYMEEGAADRAGIIPLRVVSFLQPIVNG